MKNVITAKSRIVVGARSAIFAPLPKLRLIIVDELNMKRLTNRKTHKIPRQRYCSTQAKNTNALCLLGSATPSLESINNVKEENTASANFPKE